MISIFKMVCIIQSEPRPFVHSINCMGRLWIWFRLLNDVYTVPQECTRNAFIANAFQNTEQESSTQIPYDLSFASQRDKIRLNQGCPSISHSIIQSMYILVVCIQIQII